MNVTDRMVMAWHRLRLHQSAYDPERATWYCQCGERRGLWSGSRSNRRV